MAKRFVNLVTSWASTSPRKVVKNKSGAGKSTQESKTPGKKLKSKVHRRLKWGDRLLLNVTFCR